MYSSVLAVLTRTETTGAALETARLVAQRLGGARLEPLHVRHDPMEGFLPTEEVMTPERKQALAAAEAKHSDLVKAAFEKWLGSQAEPRPSWREVIGTVEEVVAEQARHAGLVVGGHTGWQRRQHRLPVQRRPAFAAVADDPGVQHQILHHERLVTLKA